jgi:hypothetical protein
MLIAGGTEAPWTNYIISCFKKTGNRKLHLLFWEALHNGSAAFFVDKAIFLLYTASSRQGKARALYRFS